MALNPQQQAFKEAYCNPSSSTFGNVTESGVAAGYARDYAEQITSPSLGNKWVLEIISDMEMLNMAENALKDAMQYDAHDKDFAPLRLKASMFTAETLGKQKYSKRTETDVTTGGEKINGDVEQKVTSALNDYFATRDIA